MDKKMYAKSGLASSRKSKKDSRLIHSFRNTAKIFALLVFTIGLLSLIGWEFDVDLFKRILPSLPIIAPNTSILFILIPLVLLSIHTDKGVATALRRVASLLSVLVFLFGIITLFEYLFGVNLGIDNIFFAGKMGSKIVRMSPQSAFNFTAVGLALFFSSYSTSTRKGVRVGQWITIAAGIVSLVSLLGFVYDVSNLYTLTPYKGMAAQTALAFILIFSAILLLHSEEGFMRIFVGRGMSAIAARRLFGALAAVFVAEVIVMLGRRLGLYNETYESLIHLATVAGVFFFLIFFAFRSLDQLASAEQSLAEMKEIDRTKTEFVSLASHQLRTPLTSVAWYTEMLANGDAGAINEKQKRYLQEIYAGNQRMINLVEDLLNTSRIDMGSLVIKPESVDLKKTLRSVVAELAPIAKNKNVELSQDVGEDVTEMESDSELLRVVFQNLLTNAVKYTPPGGRVLVELKMQKGKVFIHIADTGYGIPINQQKKIFTKMFRADNVRTRETDGSGLGLYIAKAIVDHSGGKIWFDSVENKGTNFFVTLPLKTRKSFRTKKVVEKI